MKNNNGKNILITLLIITILLFIGYILYDKVILSSKVNNEVNNNVIDCNEENSIQNNNNNIKNDNKEKVIRSKNGYISLSNEVINLYSHTFIMITGQKKENLKFNYNYLNDYNNKYEFAKSIAKEELYWEDKTSDDEDATGGFKVSLQEFKELYNKIYDEEFDINKLVKDPSENSLISYPTIKNGYLYGVFFTGMLLANSMDYKYVDMFYDDQSNVYNLEFVAVYRNYEVEVPTIEYVGKLTFKIKITDDNTIKFVSMVLEK